MRAAPLTQRPDFQLMKQDDIQNFYHLQVPRWLFTDSTYTGLSLEAKVVYSFLLNRFQLSRLNGWVNDGGEVFIIYTRKSLAQEIQISYHKVIDCMKELSSVRLIWEKRCGRGDANQIYLAKVEGHACGAGSAPFVEAENEAASRSAGIESLDNGASPCGEPFSEESDASRSAETEPLDPEDVPLGHFKKCGSGASGAAETELLQVRNRAPSYIYPSYINRSDKDVSQSLQPTPEQDDAALAFILEECHLELFTPELGRVFRSAVEQLFYSDNLRVGHAVLPQARIRSRLWDLDYTILQVAEGKLHQNRDREVKNSVAYTMTVIFNAITEAECDAHVDPYLNAIRGEEAVP